MEYYHALKARGKQVSMNMYDDNHPLAKTENDVNVMINSAVFFKECLDKTRQDKTRQGHKRLS